MIFGIDPIALLAALFTIFFAVPFAVLYRVFDPRRYYEIETIQLKDGYNIHEVETIKGYEAETKTGLKIKPEGLFRDKLKKRKYLIYYLFGIQARYISIYKGASKEPLAYESPVVPAHVLRTARRSRVLSKGISGMFGSKGVFKTVAILLLFVIAAFLIISWYQAGGKFPEVGI